MRRVRTLEQLEKHRNKERKAQRWKNRTEEQRLHRNKNACLYAQRKREKNGLKRKLYPIPQLEHDVAVYLAGIIDGEGCFYISAQKDEIKGSHYCPQFKIVLTSEKTISWIASKLERHYTHQKGKKDKNHKDTYGVRISDHAGLVAFIEQIITFMILKKDSAQTVLDFCKSRIDTLKEKYNPSYTVSELELYSQLKKLNRVGIYTIGDVPKEADFVAPILV